MEVSTFFFLFHLSFSFLPQHTLLHYYVFQAALFTCSIRAMSRCAQAGVEGSEHLGTHSGEEQGQAA